MFYIEQKKLRWLLSSEKFLPKFNLSQNFSINNIIYLFYFWINWILVKQSFKSSRFIGIGFSYYYTFGLSKRQLSLNWNKYKLKLINKKDSWFFYGIILSVRNWFVQSTVTIWNVFYNEIIEKTFFLFNIWNTLTQSIPLDFFKNFSLKKNFWKRSKNFFLRKLPRLYSKFHFE